MMMSSRFWNVLRIAFSAGLGGFIYGYYLGLINNFPPQFWNGFNNSLARQRLPFESTYEWILYHGVGITQGLIAGIVLFSSRFNQERIQPHNPTPGLIAGIVLFSSRFNPERIKPQNLATWPCLLFIFGAFFFITFPEDLTCVGGIIVVGWGTGYIFLGSTIYLAEISPTRIRGAMVATFFLQIAVGQIVYYLISLASILHLDDKIDVQEYIERKLWMLGIIQVLFMLILRIWLPDSPNWLYAMGKKEEALEILRKTSSSIEDFARGVKDFKLAKKSITDHPHLPEIILSKNGIAGIACLVAEHLVGIDRVIYYTPRILVHVLHLDQYLVSSKYLMLATLLTKSVLSAIGTLLCIAFVDRYGRRRLLLLTTFGIITCLGFLSFVLYGSSGIADSCTITGNGDMGNLGLLALGALGLYFIFHSMGIGTIPWIISTEFYSLEYRLVLGFLTSLTYWFIKIWIGGFYIYLDHVIGQYNIGNLFFILCLSSGLAFYIIYVYALDTTLEEVEKLFLMEKISSSSDVEMVASGEEMPCMLSSSSSADE